MVRTRALKSVAAIGLLIGSAALAERAAAQTRDPSVERGSRASGTTSPGTNGTAAGGVEQRPSGGRDGLPDAVTVLDILSRLPRWPGDVSRDDDGPPERGPTPKGKPADRADDRPRRPSRVVAVDPAVPFAPRPAPRNAGAPLALTGAIVPEVRDREVVVALAASAGPNAVFELGQDLGLEGDTLYTSALLGARVVRFRILDTRAVGDVVQQLANDARVQVVQPNYIFTANGDASAAAMPVPQYAPDKLNLADAHKIAQGKRIRIAVIDTAVDTAHPVFAGTLTQTFDALGGHKATPEAHGTGIAGIVSARRQLIGVAPEANVLSVRAFSSEAGAAAQSDSLAILKGLDWSVLNGARVINMSFAGPNDVLLGQAISAAIKRGTTIVAAAGNGGANALPAYPGAYPNVIAVTAIDEKDALYANANRGTYIAVAAPGVDIVGAVPNGGYDLSSGTSMAAAHVTGIAALLLEHEPKLTPRDIRDRLSKSARQPARLIAEDMGAGIVDAAEALQPH